MKLVKLLTELVTLKRDGKYKIDDVFVIHNNEYTIDQYGSKTNAYVEYDVYDKHDKKYTMRITIKPFNRVELLPHGANWHDYRKVMDITRDIKRIK